MHYWYRSLELLNFKTTFIYYKSPTNQTYWWNFGALALYFLIVQLITGILLAMFYDPSILFSYSSIMYINNEIYYGWWIRSLHANGASFFFLCVYIHMFRGLYYGSFMYPRQLLWKTGILLFALMIAAAFLGYVLPWGQMSFWAAMVITSLVASVPIVGTDIVFLLWGGFSIEDATLHRFYVLHYLIPFIILCSLLHVLYITLLEMLKRLATGKQSYLTENSALVKWKNSKEESTFYLGKYNYIKGLYLLKNNTNMDYNIYDNKYVYLKNKELNVYDNQFYTHFQHPTLSWFYKNHGMVNVENIVLTRRPNNIKMLNELLTPIALRSSNIELLQEETNNLLIDPQYFVPLVTRYSYSYSAFDPNKIYRDQSLEYWKRLGFSPEFCEIIVKNSKILKYIDIDDTMANFMKLDLKAIKDSKLYDYETIIVNKNIIADKFVNKDV